MRVEDLSRTRVLEVFKARTSWWISHVRDAGMLGAPRHVCIQMVSQAAPPPPRAWSCAMFTRRSARLPNYHSELECACGDIYLEKRTLAWVPLFALDGENPAVGGRSARIDDDLVLSFYAPVASLGGILTSILVGLVSQGYGDTDFWFDTDVQRRRPRKG